MVARFLLSGGRCTLYKWPSTPSLPNDPANATNAARTKGESKESEKGRATKTTQRRTHTLVIEARMTPAPGVFASPPPDIFFCWGGGMLQRPCRQRACTPGGSLLGGHKYGPLPQPTPCSRQAGPYGTINKPNPMGGEPPEKRPKGGGPRGGDPLG